MKSDFSCCLFNILAFLLCGCLCCGEPGLRHIAILKLVGAELRDMGGVLELYPINGKEMSSYKLWDGNGTVDQSNIVDSSSETSFTLLIFVILQPNNTDVVIHFFSHSFPISVFTLACCITKCKLRRN